MKWHAAQKGRITTNGRIIPGCWAEDPGGQRRQPEPGGQALSPGGGGPQSPHLSGPGAPSLPLGLLCPHLQRNLLWALPQDRVRGDPEVRHQPSCIVPWLCVLPSNPRVPGLLNQPSIFSQSYHRDSILLASLSAALPPSWIQDPALDLTICVLRL